MTTETTPSRRAIAGLVLAVRDLDAAVESYRKLGFSIAHRNPRSEWGVESAWLDVDGVVFELVTPIDSTKPRGREVQTFLDERGEGLYSAAFQVADVTIEQQRLHSMGISVDEPITVPGDTGVDAHMLSLRPPGTHGAFLELVTFGQRSPETLHR